MKLQLIISGINSSYTSPLDTSASMESCILISIYHTSVNFASIIYCQANFIQGLSCILQSSQALEVQPYKLNYQKIKIKK